MARKQDRRKSSPAAAILTVLVLAALFVWRMLASPEDGKTQITLSNGELHIWFLDVGQADSSLLVCDGQAMLIDGGNVDDAELCRRQPRAVRRHVAGLCHQHAL